MKNKKSIIIIALFLLILIGISVFICNKSKIVILTQLSPTTSRQMMGYLLKTKNGKLIVIDGGTKEDSTQLLEKINENGGKIEAWFLTHSHDDHVGAFTQIANETNIEIGKIYVSVNNYEWYEKNEPLRADFTKEFLETLNMSKIKEKVIEPKLNQKIKIDGMKIEILGIKNPELIENAGNEQSMVIKFNTGKQTLLILGDTGEKSSEKLLNTQKEKLKSDIVQISHHGQRGASKELYEEISPKICLWPTPKWLWNNDIGQGEDSGPWKTLQTREWIKKLKVETNYIAKDGNCSIELK